MSQRETGKHNGTEIETRDKHTEIKDYERKDKRERTSVSNVCPKLFTKVYLKGFPPKSFFYSQNEKSFENFYLF